MSCSVIRPAFVQESSVSLTCLVRRPQGEYARYSRRVGKDMSCILKHEVLQRNDILCGTNAFTDNIHKRDW